MVALVERMLDLHQRHAAEANPQVKTMLQRQIDATDQQIDALVVELYGLTDEETAIVEGLLRNLSDCHTTPDLRYTTLMPTILIVGPYRLFFWASDRNEPPHVHVERDDRIAKFWLSPVRLQNNGGFPSAEINRIFRLVQEREEDCLRKWNEYFPD